MRILVAALLVIVSIWIVSVNEHMVAQLRIVDGQGIAGAACGKWRWDVKTLQDRDAARVNFARPLLSSVAALRAQRPPRGLTGATPRLPAETFTYWVKAYVDVVKEEADSDWHVVLRDPENMALTMIAETPHPGCAERASDSFLAQTIYVRTTIMALAGEVTSTHWTRVGREVSIRGVLFFDEVHGQRGVAPNGVELHPILEVRP